MSYKDAGFYRRKYPRRAFRRLMSFLLHGKSYMVYTSEIGEGGLSFEIVEKIPDHGDIVINFRIPGGDFVSLRAEIRSVRPGQRSHTCGLAFKNISFSSKRQIRSFVSSRTSNESLIL